MTDIGRIIAERDEWKSRAEAAERNLEDRMGDMESDVNNAYACAHKAESELATLRAELDKWELSRCGTCERLRAENERLRVLASTQPMGQAVCDGRCAERVKRTRAFLANQPAAHGTSMRGCGVTHKIGHCGWCVDGPEGEADPDYPGHAQHFAQPAAPTRTEAERRVLDACAAIVHEIAKAELARREAEK